MSPVRTEFLVVGAGPYGIAAAAYAKSLGIDVTVVGRPLEAWKRHMPRGMFLRSGPDWHLDARDAATFDAFVQERRLTTRETKPVPLDTFLDYAAWFMDRYSVTPRDTYVRHLARPGTFFVATLDDGSQVVAENVLLALGFAFFKHCPEEIVTVLPARSFTHTCETVEFDVYRNKRVLIVGGRQSAFEWAALIREHDADEVHLVLRHTTPKFAETDWSWVQPMVRRAVEDHGWWRRLGEHDQRLIRDRFWATGRLTLEEWLAPRVHQPNIHVHPETVIASAGARNDGTFDVILNDGSRLNVHRIILATGYRPAMNAVGFLDGATIVNSLQTVDGYPALDPEFQTSLPHLFVTGLAATRDFGPFFGFTVGCPVAARIVGDTVAERSAEATA